MLTYGKTADRYYGGLARNMEHGGLTRAAVGGKYYPLPDIGYNLETA